MELDIAATCGRKWPACSRPAASPEASAGYEELVRSLRCGRVGYSSRQKARCRILDRLQTPEQTVTDAVEQRIAVIQTAEYERLD